MSNTNGQATVAASAANYIFRIHNDGASDMTLQGWARSSKLGGEKIKTIKDVLKKGAAKVATSVPSPFARMHLFDTAFKMVLEDPEGDSVYHQLVSDCLDMFQLLFKAGNDDPHLRFEVWNRQERLQALKGMGDGHPHKLLADSLEMFFTGKFADVQEIILIYYKNILLGGTSPLTVFFTSPNWQRDMQEQNIVLSSAANGDVFFDMDYYPLYKRDPMFVKFMYKFYLANRTYLNQYCEGLAGYIRNTERYQKELAHKAADEWKDFVNNPRQMEAEYERVTIKPNSSTFLQTGGMYIYTVRKGNIAEMIQSESDFVIQATVDYFMEEKDPVTNEQTRHKPLVLARRMNVAGTYTYGNTPWTADIDIRRSNIMDTFGNPLPLVQRVLPGDANIRYPFVTTEDFLEDTLIKMPYQLHRQKFFTGSAGDFSYLLPVKKEYFNFFTPEDLQRNLKIIHGENMITVQLLIPVRNTKGSSHIIFSKEYELDKTPVAQLSAGMAISPFYRLTDADANLQQLNEYTVLYAEYTQDEGAMLSFWSYDNIAKGRKIQVVRPEPRTRSRSGNSYYYKVDSAFDLIELKVKDDRQRVFTGLIIPEFKKLTNRHANKQYTFAVDFGTSNSHIAYLEDRQDRKPKSFEIGPEDLQTVALQAPGTEGTPAERYSKGYDFKEILSFINREFIPMVIGKNNGSEVYFPVRTVTAEKRTFPSEAPELFHNINCGFYLDADEASGDNSPRYQTNLKWLFENSRDKSDPDRIEAFLKELMLIIRNKVIMNGGNISDTQVVWLVPLSMKQRSVELFTSKWRKAFEEVFKSSGARLLEPITESVAPYFFLKANSDANVRDFADAINIDIGGGTTDVMFLMRRSKRYLSTSFRFAGNDIWGSGCSSQNEKDNGFIRFFLSYNNEKKQLPHKADDILSRFHEDPYLTAADMISLLFRYDDHFKFSQSINRDCPQLKIVLFLHYASIIYHLVQIIEQQEIDLPRYFTFTGKGSQYLELMCAKDKLTSFTKLLLQTYTKLPVPQDFNVVLTGDPKEATANGATLFVNSPEKDKIDKDAIDIVTHWGNASSAVFDYRRNITPVATILENDTFATSVLQNMQRFVEQTLRNEAIAAFLAEYEIRHLKDYELFLTSGDATAGGELYDSFHTLLGNSGLSEADAASETYFFFPLKDALYRLSKYITEKAK
jgi:hypothetical protein